MDKGHLPFLITEDIYVLSRDVAKNETKGTREQSQREETKEASKNEVIKEIPPVSTDKVVFHGTAGNKLLVLMQEPLVDQTRELLNKMLSAVKFSLPEAAMIITTENKILDLEKINNALIFERVLFFGEKQIASTILGKDIPLYFPILVANKFVIAADNLEAIIKDVDKKKKLWEAMKKVFH